MNGDDIKWFQELDSDQKLNTLYQMLGGVHVELTRIRNRLENMESVDEQTTKKREEHRRILESADKSIKAQHEMEARKNFEAKVRK